MLEIRNRRATSSGFAIDCLAHLSPSLSPGGHAVLTRRSCRRWLSMLICRAIANRVGTDS
jgi:hypothetical protein